MIGFHRTTTTVPAGALFRNDRVVLSADESPYLVDAVKNLPGNVVRVTYSSGDVAEHAASAELTIID